MAQKREREKKEKEMLGERWYGKSATVVAILRLEYLFEEEEEEEADLLVGGPQLWTRNRALQG